MLDRYKIDMDVTEMVDSFDWYILPVTNPDGYEYTFVDDRVRAKNSSHMVTAKMIEAKKAQTTNVWSGYIHVKLCKQLSSEIV
jgi:murein tripeptide amidase MpaA